MKNNFTREQVCDLVSQYVNYDIEMIHLIINVIDFDNTRHNKRQLELKINDKLQYDAHQWTIIYHYCAPKEVSWDKAYKSFLRDMKNLCIICNGQEEAA